MREREKESNTYNRHYMTYSFYWFPLAFFSKYGILVIVKETTTQRGFGMVCKKCKNYFSLCSTCGVGSYYETKGHALNQFEGILQGFDLTLDPENVMNGWDNDEGSRTIAVVNDDGIQGYARFSWHRMDSGRYEVIGYIG